jgi:hypothetical protein
MFKKSVNEILLKISNREACLRVCDKAGIPLDVNQFLVENKF